MNANPGTVLIRPRITEKAALLSESANVYAFEVAHGSSKGSILKAVKEAYKVSPIRVNVVKLPAKTVLQKGKKGRTNKISKAYVYLKKGDKIEF